MLHNGVEQVTPALLVLARSRLELDGVNGVAGTLGGVATRHIVDAELATLALVDGIAEQVAHAQRLERVGRTARMCRAARHVLAHVDVTSHEQQTVVEQHELALAPLVCRLA